MISNTITHRVGETVVGGDDGVILRYIDPRVFLDTRKRFISVMKDRVDNGRLDDHIKRLGEITMTVSPFKKGRAEVSTSGGGRFIGVKDGESIVFAPLLGLDGMIHAQMHEYWDIRPAIFHPCIGRGCPGCAAGNEPRFKGYLPVLKNDGTGTAIYPFTISVYRKLLELEKEVDGGNLKGYVVKVKRTGTGFSTDYTVLGTGRRVDVSKEEIPEFIDSLGPVTEEDILALLLSNNIDVPGYEREPTRGKTVVVDDEPDDPDDDWLGSDDEWGDI